MARYGGVLEERDADEVDAREQQDDPADQTFQVFRPGQIPQRQEPEQQPEHRVRQQPRHDLPVGVLAVIRYGEDVAGADHEQHQPGREPGVLFERHRQQDHREHAEPGDAGLVHAHEQCGRGDDGQLERRHAGETGVEEPREHQTSPSCSAFRRSKNARMNSARPAASLRAVSVSKWSGRPLSFTRYSR